MLDPKDNHHLEQAMAAVRDTLPPALWSFYSSCKNQGFNEAQSLDLTSEYLALLMAPPASVD